MAIMRITRSILDMVVVLFLGLTFASPAVADFYIPDINGTTNPYPDTAHFDWVDRDWDGAYDHPGFIYNSGTVYSGNNGDFTVNSNTFAVQVKILAPDNWDTPAAQGGIDYSGYKPEDTGRFGGSTFQWGAAVPLGDRNFNDVYSYFYKVEQIGSGSLSSISIPYDPAQVIGYGFVDDGDGQDPFAVGPNVSDTALNVTFIPGLTTIEGTPESEWFFMTSEYWWGWQPLAYNGFAAAGQTMMDSYGNLSPNGMIPAPNPEAPTLALFMVGLLGLVAYTRMKLHREEAPQEA